MKLCFKVLMGIMLFCVKITIAQENNKYPDYLITKKGDTVICLIKIPFLSMESAYKTPSSNKSIRILPWQVKEYYISKGKMLYLSVHKNGGKVPDFMKTIEKGEINLFEENYSRLYGMTGTTGYTYSSYTTNWYIAKGNDTAKALKSSDIFFKISKKYRKNIFVDMISDKKEVLDKYTADDSFGFDELRSLIHFYNTGEWKTEFKD